MASVDHPEDLNHTCWRHDLWLASYPLTRATVLDYFALSPFYDRNCLNERAKEQGVEPSRTLYVCGCLTTQQGGTLDNPSHYIAPTLRTQHNQHVVQHSTLAPGMEYTLQDFQEPHLYIVVKQV